MRDQPDGAKLLELARATVLDDLLPNLPEDRRYSARLIANAMAIAARELAAGDAPLRADRAALDRLIGDGEETLGPHGAETLDEALQRLTWRLAAEIRAGGRDGEPAAHEVLREAAVRRLRHTNPRRVDEDREAKST